MANVKTAVLRIILLTGLIYSTLVISLNIYFIMIGGTIVWAHPYVPVDEWGQIEILPLIFVLLTILLLGFLEIRKWFQIPPSQKATSEVYKDGENAREN